jgi:iron complex outermembrane receptor protein
VLALAQAGYAEGEEKEREEITITGTHIKGTAFRGPSPVEVLTREDFELQQPELVTDITRRITANTGTEFQEDQYTQNSTSGTASVNLRGLGLSSTLVLLNGKRVVTSPGAPNSGASFADINNFPVDLIERVEILKDGGSPLYGSDAVAGVVNFITRKDFTGFELNGSWQGTTQDFLGKDSQQDMRVSAVLGAASTPRTATSCWSRTASCWVPARWAIRRASFLWGRTRAASRLSCRAPTRSATPPSAPRRSRAA